MQIYVEMITAKKKQRTKTKTYVRECNHTYAQNYVHA